jgi:hypothetical protein
MGFEYGVQRQGWRLECGDKCVLQHKGKNIECLLVDLSVSGVLVSCDEGYAVGIHLGDTCTLYLCSDPNVCQGEIVCTVTRREESLIGLQFLTATVPLS